MRRKQWLGIVFLFLFSPILPGHVSRIEADTSGPVCIGPGCSSPMDAGQMQTLLYDKFDFQKMKFEKMDDLETDQKKQDASGDSKKSSPKSKWSEQLELGMESTENVPAVSDELAPRFGDTSDTARFARFHLRGNLRDDATQRTHVELRYESNTYNSLGDYDSDYLKMQAQWGFPGKSHQWRIKPWFSRYNLGGNSFNENAGMEVAFLSRQNARRWLEISLSGQSNDFLVNPAVPAENRDSKEIRLSLFQYGRDNQDKLFWGMGLDSGKNSAEGADFDSTVVGLTGFTHFELNRRTTFFASLNNERRDYQNANSRDLQGRAREDKTWRTSLRLDYQIHRNQKIFAAFQDQRNDSNISDTFSFNSRGYSLGYTVSF